MVDKQRLSIKRTFSPALEKGQLWKMKDAHIQIMDLGKRLIHYKMLTDLRQRRQTQTTALETLEDYLNEHCAELVKGSAT